MLFCVSREESSLVDQFVFEVLVIFVESLALAHSDEQSLGNKYYRFQTEYCVPNLMISALESFVSSQERCSSAAAPSIISRESFSTNVPVSISPALKDAVQGRCSHLRRLHPNADWVFFYGSNARPFQELPSGGGGVPLRRGFMAPGTMWSPPDGVPPQVHAAFLRVCSPPPR